MPATGVKLTHRVSLHLPISVFRVLLHNCDLLGSQAEERVDAFVQQRLQLDDRLRPFAVLGLAVGQPLLPPVALVDRDVALEDLLQLGSESREAQIPPGSEFRRSPTDSGGAVSSHLSVPLR